AQAREALAVWAEAEELTRAAEENSQLRQEEFFLFDRADAATLEAVKVYESRRAFLRSARENATLRWEKAKGELKRVKSRSKIRWGLTFLAAVLGGIVPAFLPVGAGLTPLWVLGGFCFGAGLGYLG